MHKFNTVFVYRLPIDKFFLRYYNDFRFNVRMLFMIKVYLIDISRNFDFEKCIKHFPKRYEDAQRYRHNDDVLRSYAAGVLLWKVLGLEDCDIEYEKNGKPFSRKTDMRFNISHSGKWVALAVDNDEVGVDIEAPRQESLRVKERVFTQNELEYMSVEPLKNFTQLWTLKEAVMKHLGAGLSLNAKSFDVMPLIEGKSITVNNRTLFALTKIIGDCPLSVCSTNPIPDFEIIYVNK